MRNVSLLLGDCLEVLKGLPDCSVDACVTDPPYGLSFMGKAWDHSVPSVEVWREVLRVLKPGGHLLAFFGTRTYHRGVVAIEDAGFEIRDQIGWAFGSGFPKSLNLGNGWGTALKPAWEPIVVARKPLIGTVAANVLAWGTGVINVDGCRVEIERTDSIYAKNPHTVTKGGGIAAVGLGRSLYKPLAGRWPANLIHDGSDEVVGLFPVTAPSRAGGVSGLDPGMWVGKKQINRGGHDDAGGSAARFFYCAKASKADREDGLDGFAAERHADRQVDDGPGGDNPRNRTNQPRRNHHPTVKPTELMRYLCRLVTPPGGVVLDPFMGSGSTGRGAVLEGFGFTGIEIDPEYLRIAQARIEAAVSKPAPKVKPKAKPKVVPAVKVLGQLSLFDVV